MTKFMHSEPQYLLAYGGDGGDSRIVGESQLLDAYLAIVAGDDADLRRHCAEHFADEDEWQRIDNEANDRYVFHQTFEDGWLTITRIWEHPYASGIVHQVSQWISVADRLPGNADHVLAATDIYKYPRGAIRTARGWLIEGNEWYDDDTNGRVTHWMAMPPTPDELRTVAAQKQEGDRG